MAKRITCAAVSITSETDAPGQIDYALRTALRERKPAFIEIACNIAAAPCAAPGPVSSVLNGDRSDSETLNAAATAAAEFQPEKRKPLLLIGSNLRGLVAWFDEFEARPSMRTTPFVRPGVRLMHVQRREAHWRTGSQNSCWPGLMKLIERESKQSR